MGLTQMALVLLLGVTALQGDEMKASGLSEIMTPNPNKSDTLDEEKTMHSIGFEARNNMSGTYDNDSGKESRDLLLAELRQTPTKTCTSDYEVVTLAAGIPYEFTNPRYPEEEHLFGTKRCNYRFEMSDEDSTNGGRLRISCEYLRLGSYWSYFSYKDGSNYEYMTKPFSTVLASGVKTTDITARGGILGAKGRLYGCSVEVTKGCTCGKETYDTRIVGGAAVDPEYKYGWIAELFLGGTICGGSLISPSFVLTAAHCLYGLTEDDVEVRLGVHDRSNPITMLTRKSLENIVHPAYNDVTINYDYALIRIIPVPLTTSRNIFAVCLDPKDATYTTENEFIVAGWGDTEDGDLSEYLKEVTVPFVENDKCYSEIADPKKAICAGGQAGKDSCIGDSGGPLFQALTGDGDYYKVAGIVSFGPPKCGKKNQHAVYAKVAAEVDWIKEQMEPYIICKEP